TTGKDNGWRRKLQLSGARWFYSWSKNPPEHIPEGIEFVPMIFGQMNGQTMAQAGAEFQDGKLKQVLGFNEPDEKHQSNMTVEQALDLWPKLMKFDIRLGSPGCVHPDREWMKAFMKGVEERSLRVDFVAVHSYGGLDADALIRRLEAVHELFQRPIWITEFGVGDWQAKTRAENRYQPEQIVKFMEKLLPRLDALDLVERYAWFPASPDNKALGPGALFAEDGSLTHVGEAYCSL
ncbi:MAG: glycosyl hydrolase, partial [Verrucomicrobiota bacterium]